MAKVHGFGMFSGKFGNQVYFIRNGKCFVRAYSKKREDPNTWLQQMQRARFAEIQHFLKELQPVIRIGYCTPPPRMSSYNEAVQNLLRRALINVTAPDDDHPKFIIDYSNAQLSRGIIEAPLLESITRIGQEITLIWEDDLRSDVNHPSDTCLLVAMMSYDKVYIDYNIGQRSDGIGKVTLPQDFQEPVHLWIFFMNNQVELRAKKHVSDSLYLGKH
ncbi:MAG TPA: DUF6266 family protein [Lentimicrobium sp.]|nr:DUF6266 family protein [Lentimicrobium sp.]